MRRRTNAAEGFDYQVERHNHEWDDHVARTNVTAGLITWLSPRSVIDPACGDGSIVLAAENIMPMRRVVLSDISHPNFDYLREATAGLSHIDVHHQDIHDALNTAETFDVIVLTETLEHLPDPDAILRQARKVAGSLVASSPEMRQGQHDTNPEHLWEFDGVGYNEMLRDAGWNVIQKTHLSFPRLQYDFQVWVCR